MIMSCLPAQWILTAQNWIKLLWMVLCFPHRIMCIPWNMPNINLYLCNNPTNEYLQVHMFLSRYVNNNIFNYNEKSYKPLHGVPNIYLDGNVQHKTRFSCMCHAHHPDTISITDTHLLLNGDRINTSTSSFQHGPSHEKHTQLVYLTNQSGLHHSHC